LAASGRAKRRPPAGVFGPVRVAGRTVPRLARSAAPESRGGTGGGRALRPVTPGDRVLERGASLRPLAVPPPPEPPPPFPPRVPPARPRPGGFLGELFSLLVHPLLRGVPAVDPPSRAGVSAVGLPSVARLDRGDGRGGRRLGDLAAGLRGSAQHSGKPDPVRRN